MAAAALFFLLVWPSCNSRAAETATVDQSLAGLRSADVRLGRIFFRLAKRNVELCEKRGPLTGLILHSRDDYDDSVRPEAIRYFGFESDIGVEGVIPNSPAAVAGVKQDDSLVAINGVALKSANSDAPNEARQAALAALDRAGAQGPITLRLRHGGVDRTVTVAPISGCRANAEVRISDDLNAATDGGTIEVDSALMNLVPDNDELACVVAHELGHIVLNHPERLTAAHVDRGFFRVFGRNSRLIKRTETEADRLSVVLMANAGYDPFAAAKYWRTYGDRISGGLLSGATHMKWKKRAKMLQAEAAKIADHPERPIIPAWIKSRDLPLR